MTNTSIKFGHFEVVKGKLPGTKTQAFALLEALEKQGYLQVITLDDQGRSVNTSEQLPLEESMRFLITVGLKNNREASLLSETAATGSYDLFFGDNGEVCGMEMPPKSRREITLAKWVKTKHHEVTEAQVGLGMVDNCAGIGDLRSHYQSPDLYDTNALLGMPSTPIPEESSLIYTFDEFTARVVCQNEDDTRFFKLEEDDVLPKVGLGLGLHVLEHFGSFDIKEVSVSYECATETLRQRGCLGRVRFTVVVASGASASSHHYVNQLGRVDPTFANTDLEMADSINFRIKEIRYNKTEEAPTKSARVFGSGKPYSAQEPTPEVAVPVREWIPMVNQYVRVEGEEGLYTIVDFDMYRDTFILQLADSCRRDRENQLRNSRNHRINRSVFGDPIESRRGQAEEGLISVQPGRLRPYTLRY